MTAQSKFGATISIAVLLAFADARAQSLAAASPTFANDTPLELKFTGPFLQLSRVDDERPWHDAVLEYPGPAEDIVSLDVEVRIRGRSRLDNCDFPPLSIDFEREGVAGTVFAGQDRLKLVTLCKSGSSYEDYLRTEFLIYRLFNLLTDRSFRVRWATVEYVYTDTRRPRAETSAAFFIEEDREVAERLAMEVVETESIDRELLDTRYTARLALFQFLVGNTDWAVTGGPPGDLCCHNGKPLRNADGRYVVLPYDFDNSGLVNAEYAVPSEVLPIRFVRTRLYRGFCSMNDELDRAIDEIHAMRDSVINILDDPSIRDRTRDRSLEYIDDFFEIINDREERQEHFYEQCR
jgi:hypothetical protein